MGPDRLQPADLLAAWKRAGLEPLLVEFDLPEPPKGRATRAAAEFAAMLFGLQAAASSRGR